MVVERLTNNSDKRRKRSDRAYQFNICLWIAIGHSTPEIIDMLETRFDITMSRQNIDDTYRYAKKWRKIIDYLKKRYLNNISRIPIANKALRLIYLDNIYNEAMTGQIKSIASDGTRIKEKKLGEALRALNQARVEVENYNSKIEEKSKKTFPNISFKDMNDNELIQLFKERVKKYNFKNF